MVPQNLNSSTSGLRYFDIESSRLDLNKKRKRSHFYRKPTDEEYSALALLKLSHSGQSYCNRPTANPDTVEAVECKNPVMVAATKTTARMATSALGNVKNIEPCSIVIIACPLAQYASYACTMCGESFSSYQALGGHKARHRHRPPINSNTLKVSAPNPSGRIHQCFKCHKVFNTGQALGGHMRRHYDGVIGGGKKTNVITSEGGDSSDCNSNGRKPHDFDLNLPASSETYLGLTLYCSENL